MTKIDAINAKQSGDAATVGSSTQTVVMDTGDAAMLTVPLGNLALSGDYLRDGADLRILGENGEVVVIRNYFAASEAPILFTEDGARIDADVVDALVGPRIQNQVAQAETTETDANTVEPIGSVDVAVGEVFLVRSTGERVAAAKGAQVFQGDTVETGGDGSVGILFADDTSFSLGEESRMVLDELVYDPATQEGAAVFNVVQGVFTFVSGQISKTNPDAMLVSTPTATIGVRGTAGGGKVNEEGVLRIALVSEKGGIVGELVITNDGGVVVLNQPFQSTQVNSFSAAPGPVIFVSAADFGREFGGAMRALPGADNHLPDDFRNEAVRAHDAWRAELDAQQGQSDEEGDEELTDEEAAALEEETLANEEQAALDAEQLAAEGEGNEDGEFEGEGDLAEGDEEFVPLPDGFGTGDGGLTEGFAESAAGTGTLNGGDGGDFAGGTGSTGNGAGIITVTGFNLGSTSNSNSNDETTTGTTTRRDDTTTTTTTTDSYDGDNTNNTIVGSASLNSTLNGFDGMDYMFGDQPISIVSSGVTSVSVGVSGDPSVLFGGISSVTFGSTGGDDTLDGGAGNDHLWGGLGDDILIGGDGDDSFEYVFGHGSDTVTGGTGTDKILADNFGAGLDTDQLSRAVRSGDNLLFELTNGEVVTLEQQYVSGQEVESIHLLDSNNLSTNDSIIFVFSSSATGTLSYSGNFLTHAQVGTRLLFTGTGTVLDGVELNIDSNSGGSIGVTTVSGAVLNGGSTISTGTVQSVVEVEVDPAGIGSASTVLLKAGQDGVDDTINGTGFDDVIFANGGNDTLNGGAGDDLLNGGSGNDTYRFTLHQGHDEIEDASGTDVIRAAVGNELTDLTVEQLAGVKKDGNDLDLTFDDNLSNLTNRLEVELENQFAAGTQIVEEAILGHNLTAAFLDTLTFTSGANTVSSTTKAAFWGVDVGDNITFSGSTSNDGTYTVSAVDATKSTLTLSSALTNESASPSSVSASYLMDLGLQPGNTAIANNHLIAGTTGNDNLVELSTNDWIWGHGGNDTITLSNGGVDVVVGGGGNDTIVDTALTTTTHFMFQLGVDEYASLSTGTQAHVSQLGTDIIQGFDDGIDLFGLSLDDFGSIITNLRTATGTDDPTSNGVGNNFGGSGAGLIIADSVGGADAEIWFTQDTTAATGGNSYQIATVEGVDHNNITAADFFQV